MPSTRSRRETGRGSRPRLRARTQEHKEVRRRAILSAASRVFGAGDYHAITVAQVAERAGMAKGTVYLYFDTKEELFLEVAWARLQEWLAAVDRGLLGLVRAPGGQTVAELLCRTLRTRKELLRSLSLLPNVFEGEVDHAAVARFKQLILTRVGQTGMILEQALPFLRAGQGARVLLSVNAFVIGLWKMAQPGRAAAQALEDPALRPLRIDFFAALEDTVAALLAGIEVRALAGPRFATPPAGRSTAGALSRGGRERRTRG